jgi:hypothetical protein
MPAPSLVPYVREFLILQGLVRNPATAAPAENPDLPPAFLDPRDGVPGPGDRKGTEAGTNLTLGINRATGVPTSRFAGQLRLDAVEFVIRGRKPQHAGDFELALQPLLHDQRGYDLGGIRIEESLLFRGFQPIEHTSQAYTATMEFTFERSQPWAPLPAL